MGFLVSFFGFICSLLLGSFPKGRFVHCFQAMACEFRVAACMHAAPWIRKRIALVLKEDNGLILMNNGSFFIKGLLFTCLTMIPMSEIQEL